MRQLSAQLSFNCIVQIFYNTTLEAQSKLFIKQLTQTVLQTLSPKYTQSNLHLSNLHATFQKSIRKTLFKMTKLEAINKQAIQFARLCMLKQNLKNNYKKKQQMAKQTNADKVLTQTIQTKFLNQTQADIKQAQQLNNIWKSVKNNVSYTVCKQVANTLQKNLITLRFKYVKTSHIQLYQI
ncbi:Hypothetical_protein [Hexamita inflata]|uniref:Hypothetical_protein n=1 Tax=Hexamita inflata TaxID=28002 RepID=A0AA86UFE9_9EUKA|nr:Hypothetical protein HINF_LOCUS41399 [Hexamita inflata]